MNKAILLVAVFCGGCARETVVQSPEKVIVIQAPCGSNPDNFDQAGAILANGARWSYNSAKNTYEWVFSEEHQKKAAELLNGAKDKANELIVPHP